MSINDAFGDSALPEWPSSEIKPAPVLSFTKLDEAEDAVRWRINAAVIDNFLVYGAYLLCCLLLHWRVAALGHLWLLIVAGVIYHLVLEARDGQTVGKRHYGIRVVRLDGSRAGGREIAIRSAFRIIDQLPLWYASGLISMLRTGRLRRQRLGDVVAGTKVIAVDGLAVAKGTPRWMLPAATICAVLMSVFAIYAVAHAGDRALSATQRTQFIDGCQRSAAGQTVDCTCFLSRLEAFGYTTPNALNNLTKQSQSEPLSSRGTAMRATLAAAVEGCRR